MTGWLYGLPPAGIKKTGASFGRRRFAYRSQFLFCHRRLCYTYCLVVLLRGGGKPIFRPGNQRYDNSCNNRRLLHTENLFGTMILQYKTTEDGMRRQSDKHLILSLRQIETDNKSEAVTAAYQTWTQALTGAAFTDCELQIAN